MSNNLIAAGCGAVVWVCNEAVELGWLSWSTGLPIVMIAAFFAAWIVTSRRRGHER